MKTYIVETMAGEVVTDHRIVLAKTPLDAAKIGTGREVHEKREEMEWVRVTDESEAAVSWFAFK
ncbi:hypothetical protein EOA75_23170 [Mesorhizobium sp. M1A.F.Ca.IN.022.07.1.1]|uniref:hypothetical protein n=1 Tax=Mesorhizobium sp. M1A.F.Ca.IN.022.07.1.1 TaxID=2496767 RepID=UPI000FCB6800|nr:hypothetical protein [Mesorhizobium sp. M1A.F.Ca.IN.022.07.1.1]RUV89699.1 hypothetical protein EOA75_23170 [Mesorhizobium sp. M1A.F.Ca.IN.022.07.1.1]TIS69958.1 MAG: hypothetical protein E5X11_06305 [Mesorhizobium sp.]